jgi:hypothetical protein
MCYYLDPPLDLRQPVLRAAGARVTMTPTELATFGTWTGTDAELNDWLFARMVAKDAVRAAWNARHQEAMFPADLETETVGGRIVCRPRGSPRSVPFPPVRVAIMDGRVAAVSAFVDRLGIGLRLLPKNAPPESLDAARRAAAIAAAADAANAPLESCTVESVDQATGSAIVGVGAEKFRVQTAQLKDAIIATTLCEAL